jgi:hypothetical protein
MNIFIQRQSSYATNMPCQESIKDRLSYIQIYNCRSIKSRMKLLDSSDKKDTHKL